MNFLDHDMSEDPMNSSVTSITATYERLNSFTRLRNEEAIEKGTCSSHSSNCAPGSITSYNNNDKSTRRGSLKLSALFPGSSKNRGGLNSSFGETSMTRLNGNSETMLVGDDGTEPTHDDSEFSDSFSMSSSSLANNNSCSSKKWSRSSFNMCHSSLSKLPTVPVSVQEEADGDFSSSSSSVYSNVASPTSQSWGFPANIQEWELIKILGEGQFGMVYQCDRKDENHEDCRSYAIKILSKFQMVCDDQVEAIINERNVLRVANRHPFVIKLRVAWHDANLVYFLQDFLQGGELFSLMRDEDDEPKALPELQVQFYATCIADAFQYLHSKRIIYRDAKPENVLFDSYGYPTLIDFGVAKLLSARDEKTFTLVGTPRYVAPEQVLCFGHDAAVDRWALGVLVYEMLAGTHPFDESDGSDERALYKSIAEDDYPALCKDDISDRARDWVDKLLIKDRTMRMTNLLSHPWLSRMKVSALRRRALKAPWKPKLVDLQDSTHFDDWRHLESVVTKDHPKLSAKEATLFQAFDT
jgi:Protein kinase domain